MVNAETARLTISVIGAILVGVGCWLHYPPLGFVAGGALLFGVGLIGTLRAPR